jgi:23S rRNA (cytosine1962-C5)-methyltransferase
MDFRWYCARVVPTGTVVLKSGKERKVRNNYPWIQRGEVVRTEGRLEDGSLARLVSEEGEFLAVGTWNSGSRFRFRVLSKTDEPIDEAHFHNKFLEARQLRERVVTGTNAFRLVYSEADQLPGLIIDEYDGHLVVQVRSKGMETLKPVWLPALVEALRPKSVYERSEMAGREEEGLGPYAGQLHGTTPEELEIDESGIKFIVPATGGLKTGFYLDQRCTRRRLAERVKKGDRLLDGFCYTGAFSMYAAQCGATTIGVDIHEGSIGLAARNAALNGLDCAFEQANLFEWLEQEPGELFDWVILDPPAIAKTGAARDSLKWAVWKLAHRAIPHMKPGGRMIACSCSYQLDRKELVETVRLAASDRGVRMFLEDVTFQDLDHPMPIQFPESLYLKCAWLRLG